MTVKADRPGNRLMDRPEYSLKQQPLTCTANTSVFDAVLQMTEKNYGAVIVVDDQNKHDRNYIPLAPKYDSFAYQASLALAFEGITQPNGYTEEILIKYRRKFLES